MEVETELPQIHSQAVAVAALRLLAQTVRQEVLAMEVQARLPVFLALALLTQVAEAVLTVMVGPKEAVVLGVEEQALHLQLVAQARLIPAVVEAVAVGHLQFKRAAQAVPA
jgi:hypothetical protein